MEEADDMDNDDRQVGQILGRREALKILGAAGGAVGGGCGAGPARAARDSRGPGVVGQGARLALTFRVSQVGDGSCVPLEGAWVDIWHCNALGVYSDVSDPGFDTSGQQFLRGYQVTDANGVGALTTIYPGWDSGRTVHI